MAGLVTAVRRTASRGAERILGRLGLVDPPAVSIRPPRPAPPPPPPPPPPPAPVAAPVVAVAAAAAPAADGPTLSREAVEKVLDELVRPALQNDGGDITLVRVDGGDVFVRLVGSCSSCPSSIVTMRMGVERLLSEELPGFRQLIQLEPGDAS